MFCVCPAVLPEARGHLLGKGLPHGSLVCDVFLCFCHFLIWCPGSGVVLQIVLIPDLCLLPYLKYYTSVSSNSKQNCFLSMALFTQKC